MECTFLLRKVKGVHVTSDVRLRVQSFDGTRRYFFPPPRRLVHRRCNGTLTWHRTEDDETHLHSVSQPYVR